MPDTTAPVTRYARRLRRIAGPLVATLLATPQLAADEPTAIAPMTAAFAPAPMNLCAVREDGFLSGDLYGALSRHIDWHGGEMDCGGMLRPGDDGGIRLVFAEPRQGERLLIVLGIDGALDKLPEGEHNTNVTIVDETRNLFFSSGRRERCWSTIESVRPVADPGDRMLQVAGKVYCAGSLPSLSDNRSIALRDWSYSGRLLLDE